MTRYPCCEHCNKHPGRPDSPKQCGRDSHPGPCPYGKSDCLGSVPIVEPAADGAHV